ncbi:N-acetyltransferase family protein [Streptomyces sp. NPDC001177]
MCDTPHGDAPPPGSVRTSAAVTALTEAQGPSGIAIRPIGPKDTAAVAAMHGRCSPQTLLNRYLRPVSDSGPYVSRLLSTPGGQSFGARTGDGRVVAVAHLLPDHDTWEAALLVEDAHQRQGIGDALLRRLAGTARAGGLSTVHGYITCGNLPVLTIVRRLGLPFSQRVDDGLLHLILRVR